MWHRHSIVSVILVAVMLIASGCSLTAPVAKISDFTAANTEAMREAARVAGADWSFRSGLLRGLLGDINLQALDGDTLEAMDNMDQTAKDAGLWVEEDYQLGYLLGARLRVRGALGDAGIDALRGQLLDGIL